MTTLRLRYAESSIRCPRGHRADVIRNDALHRTFRLPHTDSRSAFASLQPQRMLLSLFDAPWAIPLPGQGVADTIDAPLKTSFPAEDFLR